MPDPLVACVMLTKDRPAMRERARRCFETQSYENRILVTLDNSGRPPTSFGILRNEAAKLADVHRPDIIIHWDDDDWHAPGRIRLQVEQLETSKAPCVGLASGIFYDRATGWAYQYKSSYPDYCFGASLCYWTETWRRTQFPPLKWNGAEEAWARGDDRQNGVGAVGAAWEALSLEPFLVCEVHGENTSTRIMETASEWTRMPAWDEWCRERLVVQ